MRIVCVIELLVVGAALGANGTWTAATNGNWSTTTNWSGGTVASGSTFTANFSTLNLTSDRTVTLDAPYTITNISFADATTASHNWFLSGGALLTLAGTTPTITVTNQTATISPEITGTVGLTKAGAGVLVLSGANTYTGTTSVTAGILRAGASTTVFGANAALTTSNVASAILDCNNYTVSIGSLAGGGATGGNVTLGSGTLTFGGNNTTTSYAGAISGTGNIAKAGTGTQTLTRANTYTGTTTITQGVLAAGVATSAFGSNSAIIFANTPGAILNITGFNNSVGSLAGGGSSGGDIVLGAAYLTTGGNNASTSYGGAISGTGGIIKNGSGTQTLAGLNVYTGTTTINAGTLKAGSTPSAFGSNSALTLANAAGASVDITGYHTTIGSLAGGGGTGGNITLGGATLTSGGNNTSTSFGGVISGIGGITKNGSGTLTFTGSHTYTGATTINGGILVAPIVANAGVASSIGAAGAGSENLVLDNGTLRYSGGTVATDRGFTLQSGNGTIDVSTSGAVLGMSGTVTGSGNLIKSGVGVLSLSGANNNAGSVTVSAGILRAGASGTPFGTLPLVNVSNVAGAYLDLADNNVIIGQLSGGGSTGGWVTLGSGILTTGGNNGTGTYAGTLSGTGGLTKTGTGSLTLTRANTYTGPTTVSGGVLVAGVAATAFGVNSAVTLANAADAQLSLNNLAETVGSLSGGGALGGNVSLGSAILTTGGNGTLTSYAGVISGTGGITKLGAGVQTLAGANTYTGATTISAGTLKAGSIANAFGTNSALSFGNVAGAILDITGYATTVGSITGGGTTGGNISLGDATLTIGTNNTSPAAYAGVISGTGGITKTGTGTLTLTGSNTYTGTTTLGGGTVSTGTLTNGGFASPIGQAAATSDKLVFNGGGLLYSGGTATVNRGFTLESGGGTVNVSTTATVLTTSGIVAGSGTLTKAGTGILVLSGVNTFTGGTSITAGTLRAGSVGALGVNSPVSITNTASTILDLSNNSVTIGALSGGGATGGTITLGSGTLTLGNNNADASFDGVISGTGGVVKAGSGTQTFTRASTFTGPFTINGGKAAIATFPNGGAASPVGQSSNAATNLVFNGGTLSYSGATASCDRNYTLNGSGGTFEITSSSATLTLSGTGSGTGGLTKAGAGILVPSSSNSYTGATQINGGVLSIASIANGGVASRLGQSSSAATNMVLDNGTLRYTGSTAGTDRNFTLGAGGGTIDVSSSGTTLTLSGGGTGSGGLTKSGTGKVALTGTHTFTGTTSIAAGTLHLTGSLASTLISVASGATLSGTGSVNGEVSVGGILTPGNSGVGTLTVNNTMTVASSGELQIDISKSGAVLQNDSIKGVTTLQCGGTLSVAWSGTALAAGDAFSIFNASTITGTFSTVTLPALDAGLVWNTANLYTSGILSVQQTQVIAFGALADKIISQPDFALTATASSLLPVSYSSSNSNVATVSGSTVHLTGLGTTTITAAQNGNAYYAAASSVNQTLFVDSNHVPAPFTLVSPIDNSEGTVTPQLSWNASSDVDPTDPVLSYSVEIAADSQFTQNKIRYTGIAATSYNVAGGALSGHGRYYWRIFAKDSWPDSTVSSNVGVFRTANNAPTSFALASPADGISSPLLPELTWNASSDADPVDASNISYVVEIDNDATFTSPLARVNAGSASSYQTVWEDGLTRKNSFYWRVFAKDPYPDSVVSSSVRSFTVTNRAPSAPVLTTPGHGAVASATSLLVWQAATDPDTLDGIASYTVEIDDASQFTSIDVQKTGITQSQAQLALSDGLVGHRSYFWRVWAKDTHGDSTLCSAVFEFTTTNSLPAVSVLLSPLSNVETSVIPELSWSASSDPDPVDVNLTYIVEIASDSQFTQNRIRYTGISATTFTVPSAALDGHAKYYWRVFAKDTWPDSTVSSTVGVFRTANNAPTSFSLASPSDGTSSPLLPALSWNASSDADPVDALNISYIVEIDNDATFTTPLARVNAGSASSYQTVWENGLTRKNSFYWRVFAKDTYPDSVVSSSIRSFTVTNRTPSAPVLTTPEDGAVTSATSLLVWQAAADPDTLDGIASYTVEIDDVPQFTSIDVRKTGVTQAQLRLTLADGLVGHRSYSWRVWAKDTHGDSTLSSEVFMFTTSNSLPTTFEITSPLSNSETSVAPQLMWNASSDADPADVNLTYCVEIALDSQFTQNKIRYAGITANDYTVPGGALYGHAKYYWRVFAKDTWPDSTVSGSIGVFRTVNTLPQAVNLLTPASGGEVDHTPRLTWSATSDIDPVDSVFTYTLLIGEDSGFIQKKKVVSISEGEAYQVTVADNLEGNRWYYWKIFSKSNATDSTASAVRRFFVANTAPDQVTLLSPARGSDAPLTPTFDWSDGTDTDPVDAGNMTYVLEVSMHQDFSVLHIRKENLTSSRYIATATDNLADNTQYYWRVWSKDTYPDSTASMESSLFVNAFNQAPNLSTPLGPPDSTEMSSTDSLMWTRRDADPGDSLLYDIRISRDVSFTQIVAGKTGCSGTTIALQNLDGYDTLPDNRYYYWQVDAIDPSGMRSGFTSGRNVFALNKVNNAPEQPAALKPDAEVSLGLDKYLSWISLDADSIGKNPDTRTMSIVVDDDREFGSPLGMVTGITGDSVSIGILNDSLRLTDNNRYFWEVAATDNHGVRGEFAGATEPFWFNSANNPPSQPDIRSPKAGDQAGPLDSICWTASTDPDPNDSILYVVQISQSSDFSYLFSTDTVEGLCIQMRDVEGYRHLRTGSSYYFRIYSIDNARSASAFASEGGLRVVYSSTPPELPASFYPADDSVLFPTEELTWTKGKDPDAGKNDSVLYMIELSPQANFGTVVVRDTISDTAVVVESLEGATALGDNARYYWRIKVVDNHQAASGFSVSHRFYLDKSNVPPNGTVVLTPQDSGIVKSGSLLTWKSANDPDPGNSISYRIIAATSKDFSDTVVLVSKITDTSVLLDTLMSQNTAYRPDSLMHDTAGLYDNRFYYWSVVAVDNHNAYSPPSVPRCIYVNMTNDTPSVPYALTPGFGRMVFPSEKLQWEDSSEVEFRDPVRYIVMLADDSLFSKIALTDTIETVMSTRIDYLDGISKVTPEKYYYWKVAGIDASYVQSEFSQPASIYYSLRNDPPVRVTGVLPVDGATTLGPLDKIKWNAAEDQNLDSVYYEVRISDVSLDTSLTDSMYLVTRRGLAAAGVRLNTIGPLYGRLQTETSYYFRVRAYDEHQAYSAWSQQGAFLFRSTPPGDPATEDADDITREIFDTLEWQPSTDEDAGAFDTLRYIVELSSTESFDRILSRDTAYGLPKLPLMSITSVDSLLDDAEYVWRVKALDVHGSVSDWSNVVPFRFNRSNSAPRQVEIMNLSNDKAVSLRSFSKIKWSCSDPEKDSLVYRVEIAKDSLFIYGVISLAGYSDSAIRIEELPSHALRLHTDSIYRIRIRATDVKGLSGEWSTIGRFRYDAVDNVASPPIITFPGHNGYAVGSDSILWKKSVDEEDSVITYQVAIHADTNELAVAFADSVITSAGDIQAQLMSKMRGYDSLKRNTFYWLKVNPSSLVDTQWVAGQGSGWHPFVFGDARIALPEEVCHVSVIIPGDMQSSVARSSDSLIAVQFPPTAFATPTAVRITTLSAEGDSLTNADSTTARLSALVDKANSYAAGDRSMWPVKEPAFSIETFALSDSLEPGKLLDTVTMFIAYHDKDNDGFVDGDARIPDSVLHVFLLDEISGRWMPLPMAENSGNGMSAGLVKKSMAQGSSMRCKAVKTAHFSIYGIMAFKKFTEPFGEFKVYPSPFLLGKGDKKVAISYRLGDDASIDIAVFSMDGGLVYKHHIAMGDPLYGTASASEIRFPWNGRNSAGRLAGNGMYLVKVHVASKSGKKYNVQQYLGVVR